MRLELTTLKQIRERLIDELQIGFYGTADSVTTTGVSWVLRFQNSNWGANQFKGWWGHRPDQTANDVVKSMTLLSGPALSHGSLVYTDVGANKYFSLTRPDWHPTIYVLPLINRALEKCWQWWRTVLTPVVDGDMETTGVAAWTASSATLAKGTFAWTGTQGLTVTATGANGYAESQPFDVAPQRGFRATVMMRQVTAAGGQLQILDAVTNTVIAQSQVTQQTGWTEVMLTGTFPPTTYLAKVRLVGTVNGGITAWDELVIYWNLQTRLVLPAWVTQWRTEEGEEALRIYQRANRLGSIDAWSAAAYDLALVDPRDYQILQQPSAGVTGGGLMMEMSRDITSSMPTWPMVIEARRPFADFGVLAAETDVTAAPLRLVVAAAKCLAGLERRELNDRLPMWEHDFIREQQRVASMLQTPAVDNARGQAWQVLK